MGVTLREWSEQWLEVYVKPVAKPSGYEHYYDNMYKHILPKLGEMPLESLTTAVVQHFLNEESQHGNLRTGGALHITQTVRRVMVDPEAEYGKRTELIFSSAKSDASERDLYLPEVLQSLPPVRLSRVSMLQQFRVCLDTRM